VTTVTWFGHSSVVLEMDDTRLATDPVLQRRVAHLVRERAVKRWELGRVDGILVSHVHHDHLHLASIREFDRRVTVIVPRHAGTILTRRGFTSVVEVEPGDCIEVGRVRVDVTEAEHGEVRRWVRAHAAAVGYVVRGSSDVYFAGDTDLFAGMHDLAPLDVALIPVAGWGPRLPPGHLDPTRAAEAVRLLEPRIAVPIHWGTYRRLLARPLDGDPPEEFRRAVATAAPRVDVRVLALGETLYV
jgi:L-ascorbate metabolism protein UlaG (beta-lactamase superfamily)